MYAKVAGEKLTEANSGFSRFSKKSRQHAIGPDALQAKVILLGNTGSGKSCLVRRYAEKNYHGVRQSTIGVAHFSKQEKVKGNNIRMYIWDTTGDEKFRSLTRLYYRDAKAAVICYDLTDRKSWEGVGYWVDELVSKEECMIYLVGTKRDLLTDRQYNHQRAASKQEINHLRLTHPRADIRRIYETSSKTGDSVDVLFHDIAGDFNEQNSLAEEQVDNFRRSLSLIDAEETKLKSKSSCCGV